MSQADPITDLSGGLDASFESALAEIPAIPDFGENHAFWLFDDAGEITVHFHVENVPDAWPNRRELGQISLPDGRLLIAQGEGTATAPPVVGGALMLFRCETPFRRWTGRFRGSARDTSEKQLAAGPLVDGPRAIVDLQFDGAMAVPPWIQGSISKLAAIQMKREAGTFVGGWRYEQLFRARVSLAIDGESRNFSATGLRTHRRGPRNVQVMLGHSWQTAVFPSGRAFGLLRFPTADGGVGFSEAFVHQDGRHIEARIVESPWLTGLETRGERFAIELESELGRHRIESETVASVFRTLVGSGLEMGWTRQGVHADGNLVLAQAGARYRWDGEQTHGLLERSATVAKLVG